MLEMQLDLFRTSFTGGVTKLPTKGNVNKGYPKGSANSPNAYKSKHKVRRAQNPVDKGLWKKDMTKGA